MLCDSVIRVSEEEFGSEPIELLLENDKTLLVSTLKSCFPSAVGKKMCNIFFAFCLFILGSF